VSALANRDIWVFDLDNTLYPAHTAVMSQVEQRMTEFVMRTLDLDREAAFKVQHGYWHEYGTTLNGLMVNHGTAVSDFLDFVHDIDHSVLQPNPVLAGHIAALDGARIIYTNGSVRHAENVLARLGLDHLFDGIFDIAAADYTPKPQRESFDRFIKRHAVNPARAVMFEDSARNLETAAGIGFATVLVRAREDAGNGHTAGPDEHPEFVDYAVDCLDTFLGEVVETLKETPA